MLVELKIQNFGIIEDLVWRLHTGLNVVTGETGAGKSLLIDSLQFLLFGKADGDEIRHGADEAQVEGIFHLMESDRIVSLMEALSSKGIAIEDETLVVECRLRRNAPFVARVNLRAVPKALLNTVGRSLVDVHGEGERSSLLERQSYLDILDSYARCLSLRKEMERSFAELCKTEQDLRDLEKSAEDRLRREDFLRFQIDEIERAKLRESEEEELQKEKVVLASAEKLRGFASEVYSVLNGDETSGYSDPVVRRLNQSVQAMKRLVALDTTLTEQLKTMEDAVYSLSEAARDIHAYSERVRSDPGRLEEVESRLEQIRALKRKYGQTVSDILAYRAQAEEELAAISDTVEKREQLGKMRAELKQECGRIACVLSQQRSSAAARLEADVMRELTDLDMPLVEFRILVVQRPGSDGVTFPDGKSYELHDTGVDVIEFMASTNPGEPIKPLAKIASTGEMSRFALALKGALAEFDHTPVLVFDEIDLGVGGRSGEIVGKKLWTLARNHQVICVTHLPQIAAFADAHFNVQKVTSGDRTLSVLEDLENKSRVIELAVMLSGSSLTETSMRNARELLRRATAWKSSHSKAR